MAITQGKVKCCFCCDAISMMIVHRLTSKIQKGHLLIFQVRRGIKSLQKTVAFVKRMGDGDTKQWGECGICQRCLCKQVMKPITESVNSHRCHPQLSGGLWRNVWICYNRGFSYFFLPLNENDKQVHSTFCVDFLGMIPDNENLK
jgi:hypothetical protein